MKPDQHEPLEIGADEQDGGGDWIGFAILLIAVGVVMGGLLLWLTGSFLIAATMTVGMIAFMLVMGWMASGAFDRRT